MCPGMPLHMGFIVSYMPVEIMNGLMTQYGSVYAQQTILGGTDSRSVSRAINLSGIDNAGQKYFHDAAVEDGKVLSELEQSKVDEEVLQNEELVSLWLDETTTLTDKQIEAHAKKCYINATTKYRWDSAETLKGYQLSSMEGRKNDKFKRKYLECARALPEAFDIDAWCFRQIRSNFFGHWK